MYRPVPIDPSHQDRKDELDAALLEFETPLNKFGLVRTRDGQVAPGPNWSSSSVGNFGPYSHLPITKQPTCEDALAALVKQPVNKKKRTKRVECEQAESSHANEQLQTVCWDPLANQHNKPDKKKRKIPPKVDPNQHNKPDKKKRRIRPKVDCGPVVKNEVTGRLQKFITDEMNGSDLKLVIQKVLYMSDLAPRQNRLSLPLKQLLTEDFLSDQERWILESDGEIKVRLVGPNLKMFKDLMELKIWDMTRTSNLVLTSKWKQFVEENKDYLNELSMIQIWSFRKEQQLCFALAVVDRPPLYLMASNGIA
nr:B3 domain-containing protein, DNA-binding pseudobarrel domain protein [Tanacetum cinerariifolium]